MPDFRVVPLNAIVEVNVRGEIDFESARRLLLRLADDVSAAGANLFVDIRAVSGALSFREVFKMVRLLGERPTAFAGRIALFDDYGAEFEKVQFFEASATEFGFSVRAFIDEERARAWLEAADE